MGRTQPRRIVTRRKLGLLVGSAVMALVITACGGNGETQGSDDEEKVLNLAMSVPAVTHDPAKAITDALWALELAYDPVIFKAPDGSLEPRLAESWSYIGDDNSVFEVKLREGVKFSDGSDLTAEVLKRNIEYYRDTAAAGSKVSSWETIELVDDLTVRIHLSTPHPAMPEMFTQQKFIGDLASGPALDDPDRMATETFGAGPYVLDLDQTIQKDTYTYLPNPHYWNPDDIHYDKVVLKVIDNPNTALAALRSGQIDVVQGDFTTAQAAIDAGLQVVTTPRQWIGVIIADADGTIVPALGDVRVRQALNYAVDREALAEGLLGDLGMPTEQIVMPGQSGYNDTPFYTYDPEKAKDLLAAAGYPDGFTMPVTTTARRGTLIVVQALVDEWKKIGVEVELVVEADDGARSEGQLAGEQPVFGQAFGSDGELHNMAATLYQNSATYNPLKIQDPVIDELVLEAAATADDDARNEVYKELVRRLVEQGRFVAAVSAPAVFYAGSAIEGLEISPGAQFANPVDFRPAD